MDLPNFVISHKFNQYDNLEIKISYGFLETNIKIARPNLHGPDMWQYIRDSKDSKNRYDECKITKPGYNIKVVFNDIEGAHIIVGSENGMLTFYSRQGSLENENLNIIKIPIEYSFEMLDSIILHLKDIKKKND